MNNSRIFHVYLKRGFSSRVSGKKVAISVPYTADDEYALGSKLHTILYAREGRFSRHSGSVSYNTSKSGNISGGDFYRNWTVKLMNCTRVSAGKVSFTVQVR